MKVDQIYLIKTIRFVHLCWILGDKPERRFSMKKLSLLFSVFLIALNLSGQVNKYGLPYMYSYSNQKMGGGDYTHSIIEDLSGNIYFANEGSGIIRYDGNSWRIIHIRNDRYIRAMGIDSRGTIYAAGLYEFGYLEPDNIGKLEYVSLAERIEKKNSEILKDTLNSNIDSLKASIVTIPEILTLAVADSTVLFFSPSMIFRYNIYNDNLDYINLRDYDIRNVWRGFLVNGRVIFGDNSSGLYEYVDEEVRRLPGGNFFSGVRIASIMSYDDNRVLVATLQNGVFLYDYVTGKIDRNFLRPDINELIGQSNIYCAVSLPYGEFALGTMSSGVFIISHQGALVSHWNVENSYVQDNGTLFLYCNGNPDGELWISSIKFITKSYINLPLTEYSLKSGIGGGVDYISEIGNEVFLTTDIGAYRSVTNKDGAREFKKLPEINLSAYPVVKLNYAGTDIVLVGSLSGLFKIGSDGKAEKIIARDENNKPRPIEFDIRNITQSQIDPGKLYLNLDRGGFTEIEYRSGIWIYRGNVTKTQGSISGLVELENGDIIFGTNFNNELFRKSLNDSLLIPYTSEKGAPSSSIRNIVKIDNEIFLCTGNGIYRYVKDNDSWVPYDEITGGFSKGKEVNGIVKDDEGDFWVSLNTGIRSADMLFKKTDSLIIPYFGPLALLPNVNMMDFKSFDNKLWLAKSTSVFVIDKEKLLVEPSFKFSPHLSRIVVGSDSVIMEESFFYRLNDGRKIVIKDQKSEIIPELRYTLNAVSFFWSLPYFVSEESTLFSYKLDGFDNKWSGWEHLFSKEYTNLPYGHYFFRIKARTVTELESPEFVFEFIILKPWYLKAYMIILYIIGFVLLIFGIVRAYTKKLKNENIRLEGIVAERTAVVVKQKEELESSIHYARRIQMALLPSESILSENLSNYFILFKPRDIVSGDFYWMTKKNNRLYIVAADCTGHGVPGAFMSLLGMSFLDEIIDKENAPSADYILSELRLHVTESLKQSGVDNEAKDGMDLALLVIDFNSSRVEFSGAYNPCFRVRRMTEEETRLHREDNMEMPDGSMTDGSYILETIYASKMPIGISSRMNESFVFNDWSLEKGVSYYLFSDGYIDQFGGANGRKFMKKNFKRLILELQDYPMKKQKEMLEQNLKEWMGQSPQIDDILVMGIKTE